MRVDAFHRPGPVAALLALAAAIVSTPAHAQDTLPALATEVAFPNLRFDRPVAMAYPNDGGNLLFVVEQKGDHPVLPERTADRRTRRSSSTSPTGSTAPAPAATTRRGCSAWPSTRSTGRTASSSSTTRPMRGRPVGVRWWLATASRPTTPARPTRTARSASGSARPTRTATTTAAASSSAPTASSTSPWATAAPPTTRSSPARTRATGSASILRIDVDNPSGGKPYGIPADNPRLRDPRRFARWAPEVYAIGLRNVWKFTFDRETGTLWAGDVGQNLWEEVDIIVNGGNYGWSAMEGFHRFNKRQRVPVRPSDLIPPVAEYPHKPDQAPGRNDTGQERHRRLRLPRPEPSRSGRRLRLRRL